MSGKVMSPEQARAALADLNATIAFAAQMLEQQRDMLSRFFYEQERMDSIGAILDPTLFMSVERRKAEDVLSPVYRAALKFIDAMARARVHHAPPAHAHNASKGNPHNG